MRRRTGSVQNRYVESCNKNFINRQWPLATHSAYAHGMSIRPIQVEITLYLGQNRYRKPRCRIGLFLFHTVCAFSDYESLASVTASVTDSSGGFRLESCNLQIRSSVRAM